MLIRAWLLFLFVAFVIGCGGLGGSSNGNLTFRTTNALATALASNTSNGVIYYITANPSTGTGTGTGTGGGTGGTTGGGSFSSLDPRSGSPTTLATFTEGPVAVAVADDGRTAYVALRTQFAKIDLQTPQNVTYFTVGSDATIGQYAPFDIAVLPGHSNSVAVTYVGTSDYSHTNTAIFTDGVMQPNPVSGSATDGLSFVSASQLVGIRKSGAVVSLVKMAADPAGITLQSAIPLNVSDPSAIEMQAGDGRVYLRSGEVFDIADGSLIKKFDVPWPQMAIGIVPSRKRLYFWAGFNLLLSYDSQGAITPLPVKNLPASGGLPSRPMAAFGQNGLAFIQSDGTIGLVQHAP